ncbi:MAG: hypothetical protein U0354_04895 [Candidatus Sericytochromatia bacterium]
MKNTDVSKKYNDALDLLQIAFDESDYSILSDSMDLFLEIISFDENFTEAYFCLAYISSILNNKTYTKLLIEKVLELEPFNINAQKMLKEIATDSISVMDNNITKQNFLNNIKQGFK